ncbi:hybrid sensor histidine kinase/response regulator [Noviherbaspirillum sp. Root189]|uniref:hybrid sensor histidine kinase/response regulator n=1 Tax=Noviherbaspirillum sp. Root189 TaxID=1736487 RepID=UPI000A8BEBDF|nr:ATP-binding protein [Noviherbaspirillum sp. Root189]
MTSDNRPSAPDSNEDLTDLVRQLRSANENLVLAAVHAQTMKDEAEAANRRQNEFLAMLAHELRNPLAPISMAATLLEGIADAHPDLPKLHTVIQRQTEQMASLLDDLLDAARISSGRIVLKKKPILLSEIIERATEASQPNLQKRKQTLRLDMPAVDTMLEGDPVRLAQVFSNLLLNASKFSPDHSVISLAVKTRDDEHGDGQLSVVISDQGVGIPADVLPGIFDLFVQGPRSLARSEGGLGIGLSVVRSLVQMHGGTVAAHSDGEGRGSSFTVILPNTASTTSGNDVTPNSHGVSSARRILVIEDNVDANQTLVDFLSLQGHVVRAAYDGLSGLAMAKAEIYDAIICDIGLPGIDGFAVAREMRALSGIAGPLLVALTGYGQPEDRKRAIEAGFDELMVKPINVQSLLSLIAEYVTTE